MTFLERVYETGIRDGIEMALRLSLGDNIKESEHFAFDGIVTAQYRKWAQDALDRIEQEKELELFELKRKL